MHMAVVHVHALCMMSRSRKRSHCICNFLILILQIKEFHAVIILENPPKCVSEGAIFQKFSGGSTPPDPHRRAYLHTLVLSLEKDPPLSKILDLPLLIPPRNFTCFARPFFLVRGWVLGTRLLSTVFTPSDPFSLSLNTQTFFLAFPPLVGFAEPAFFEGCFPFCCVFPFCCCLGGCRRKIKYSSYLQIFKRTKNNLTESQ